MNQSKINILPALSDNNVCVSYQDLTSYILQYRSELVMLDLDLARNYMVLKTRC